MADLAYTWKSQGKPQNALTLLEDCSQLRKKVLGPDHSNTRQFSHDLRDWQDEHNMTLEEKPPPAPTQTEHLQEVIAWRTTAAVIVHPSHEEHITRTDHTS
jgi:hypothetical protein